MYITFFLCSIRININVLIVSIINMGANTSNEKHQCLNFERILDAEYQIYIGIGTNGTNRIQETQSTQRTQGTQNTQSTQGTQCTQSTNLQVIRFGDYKQKYHRLIKCTEIDQQTMYYEFEHGINMNLERIGNQILIDLYDPTRSMTISKEIDPIVVKHYKPIRLNTVSKDLDKIYTLFQTSQVTVGHI